MIARIKWALFHKGWMSGFKIGTQAGKHDAIADVIDVLQDISHEYKRSKQAQEALNELEQYLNDEIYKKAKND